MFDYQMIRFLVGGSKKDLRYRHDYSILGNREFVGKWGAPDIDTSVADTLLTIMLLIVYAFDINNLLSFLIDEDSQQLTSLTSTILEDVRQMTIDQLFSENTLKLLFQRFSEAVEEHPLAFEPFCPSGLSFQFDGQNQSNVSVSIGQHLTILYKYHKLDLQVVIQRALREILSRQHQDEKYDHIIDSLGGPAKTNDKIEKLAAALSIGSFDQLLKNVRSIMSPLDPTLEPISVNFDIFVNFDDAAYSRGVVTFSFSRTSSRSLSQRHRGRKAFQRLLDSTVYLVSERFTVLVIFVLSIAILVLGLLITIGLIPGVSESRAANVLTYSGAIASALIGVGPKIIYRNWTYYDVFRMQRSLLSVSDINRNFPEYEDRARIFTELYKRANTGEIPVTGSYTCAFVCEKRDDGFVCDEGIPLASVIRSTDGLIYVSLSHHTLTLVIPGFSFSNVSGLGTEARKRRKVKYMIRINEGVLTYVRGSTPETACHFEDSGESSEIPVADFNEVAPATLYVGYGTPTLP
ncbi:uncharacterized protein MELLADRAFT_89462 [Melampsora larici-populina 98AG31]|uniref:Uncharacterized protein n=1 Tax=Melampsora larici-populina (strain 98AG31 / pathotype 3-4-7) TaxID=747676 RepID=F4RTG5_MELLP|nr:uncharacterized protein MELLADRAFT_89462 [Melampsora larici-populina 98AG31]EGG04341.1 hypothetical protein MELLADRAFT_89462 [Melampsora larici-populina 98AG31]